MFNPATGGAGTYPVSYSFTNQFGCIGTVSRNITVNAPTNLTIDAIAPTCQSAQPILLKANVSGGTWIGEHVFGDFLNPQNATTNTIVTYQYTNNLGCISNRSITVQILPKQVVNLNLNNKVCINE